MVIKLGMVGISEGDGHPFSFSAIINGYSDTGFQKAGWDVIYDYLRVRDMSEFGFDEVAVTHAWTQNIDTTRILCEACNIPNVVINIEDMIGKVDGVIIARDDYESHFKLAYQFLKNGLYVFVDKPLSLNFEELKLLKPYLENGMLMSCSGMRYAKELDEIRQLFEMDSSFKIIRGTIVNGWEKYGVHLLDAIYSFVDFEPVSVKALNTDHQSMLISMKNQKHLQIDCIGSGPKVLRLDIIKDDSIHIVDIKDNFSMFRRTLWHFIDMIRTKRIQICPDNTLTIMKVLAAGQISLTEKREVFLEELKIM